MYSIMFYGGLTLAILLLIASALIFFLMDIPKAIGVLTGSTEKRALEEMRAKREVDDAMSEHSVELTQSQRLAAARREAQKIKAARRVGVFDVSDGAPEDDEATEVLRDRAVVPGVGDDEVTEVLREAGEDTPGHESGARTLDSVIDDDEYDEKTAVLRQLDSDYSEYDDGDDSQDDSYESDEDEETEVLRGLDSEYIESHKVHRTLDSGEETPAAESISGSYEDELTAVLSSDMRPEIEIPGITVLYSVTVVHTKEEL